MSFVDARFNVADAGTKAMGNREIWIDLVNTNRFTVGFMGRKMARAFEEAQRRERASSESQAARPGQEPRWEQASQGE